MLTLVICLCSSPCLAQVGQIDLLIKGGHVIDPKNQIDAFMDVAIAAGKVVQVAAEIPANAAKTVVDARGLYVTPGLVDIHTHVFFGTEPDADYSNSYGSVPPDGFTFRAGVTTVVDAGGAGWRNFRQFKEQTVNHSKTRVLALLNIVGSGMKGGPVEQDLSDMDPRLTAMCIKQNPGILVGVKVAHYEGPEWDPVDRGVEAGRLANVPVMIDFGEFLPKRPFKDLVLVHLRPGDIYTHAYYGQVPLLDEQGRVRPYFFEAQKRGVIFDAGHGGASFPFRHAVPAMAQGFVPNSISTDLHVNSMNAGMKDMLNVMSKFLNLGMPLADAVLRSTWNPSREINRPDLGHLSVGATADVAVLNLRQGRFGFVDAEGGKLPGTQKLECELTIHDGQVVWDLNGISKPDWEKVPPKWVPVK
jgi:dihydroorotase